MVVGKKIPVKNGVAAEDYISVEKNVGILF